MPERPQPTFVVGAGEAGTEILETIRATVEREGVADSYSFLAIDSNDASLPDDAGIETITLELPEAFDQDSQVRQYPYLTSDMNLQSSGANRQRPVGRYKLDSRHDRADKGYTADVRRLYNAIRGHFADLDMTLHPDDFFSVYYLHSLGGGTGSGTFPLMGAILSVMAEDIERDFGVDVFRCGIGVVPEDPLRIINPPGEPRYYPNAYASLNDLEKLVNATPDDDVEIPILARETRRRSAVDGSADGVEGALQERIPVDGSPFDTYFLVSVDEGRIDGARKETELEHYQDRIDQTIAECVYTLSRFDDNLIDNRFQSPAVVGGIGQAEVTLPIDRIEDYCEDKAELGEKEDRLDDLEEELAEINERIDELSDVRRRPERIPEILDVGEEDSMDETFGGSVGDDDADPLESYIDGRLNRHLGTGSAITTISEADVARVFDDVEEVYGLEALPLVVERTIDHVASGVEEAQDNWRETVGELWKEHNVAADEEFGNIDPGDEVPINAKARNLGLWFEESIEEARATVERLEDQQEEQEDDDGWWPFGDDEEEGSTELDEWEAWLQRLENEHADLAEAQQRVDAARTIEQWIREFRADVEERLKAREDDKEAEREQKQAEVSEVRSRVRDLRSSVEDLADELTDAAFTRRLGRLPVNLEAGEGEAARELTTDRLENLDGLVDFVEAGFVEEDVLRQAIENQSDDARSTLQFNYTADLQRIDGDDYFWTTYSEEFAESPYTDYLPGGEGYSFSDGNLSTINDRYSVKFHHFMTRGPVEALQVYQDLERHATKGDFDTMVPDDDWRRAFAYMEWYGRDVKDAFKIDTELRLPRPPELDVGNITWAPGTTEAEKINYVSKNGLSAYLWNGVTWDRYESPGADEDSFDGWRDKLHRKTGVSWSRFQSLSPTPQQKQKWLDEGIVTWEELLEDYRRNLIDEEGIDVEWTGE